MGRPRASGAAASSVTAREDVLSAAAELFTTAGYATTTTRAIADLAGLKQASLYYHFRTKEAILAELLAETVRPSLRLGQAVLARREPVAVRLWALAYSDIWLLGSARHNVGALYLLPELGTGSFIEFRADRAALKDTYRRLVTEVLGGSHGPLDVLTDLVFALVEGVITARKETDELDVASYASAGADSTLRVLDARVDERVRDRALALLADLDTDKSP